MADLKPCPFCGRTPVIEDCGTNRYFIRCKCGIAQDKLYAQRCDAVRRWNTRKYAIDPVKHGKWIEEPNCWYRCTNCGQHYPSIRGYMDYNYCPNCGAKMERSEE